MPPFLFVRKLTFSPKKEKRNMTEKRQIIIQPPIYNNGSLLLWFGRKEKATLRVFTEENNTSWPFSMKEKNTSARKKK